MACALSPKGLLLLSLFAFDVLANPFGTINDPYVLGQHNEHEMITRVAFQCPPGQKSDGVCFEPISLNQLAGTHRPFPLRGMNGAVGSPDTFDPKPEGSKAHCDDADYIDIPGYPRNRTEATQKLEECVTHLRNRFKQAWQSAERLLNDKQEIREEQVDLSQFGGGDCTFSFAYLQINIAGRAKCNTIEGLGRALHGVEDFYSHSNWADHANSNKPINDVNPPGLGISAPAPFLDLRTDYDISVDVPLNLSTGCYIPIDKSPGILGCKGRVTHATLNKDHGIIGLDGSIGPAGPHTPRSNVPGNFALAVRAAVRDARRQWDLLRDEIKRQYGDERGNLMICALVRDDPIKDCRGRRIAIVVDSSSSNQDTDPGFLRVQAAVDFNKKLTTNADAGPNGKPDNVTVIDFDTSARVIYPFGDPAAATFDGIDASGGTDIGSGISLAIDQIIQGQDKDTISHRSGMVVLTDGQDGNPANQIAQLVRCALLGIRVNYGFLSPPDIPTKKNKRSHVKRQSARSDVQQAILDTGGVFGTIDSAEAQKRFIDTVIARGATDIDSIRGSLLLTSGVTVTDFIDANNTVGRYIYNAAANEKLVFRVALVDGFTTELSVALRDVRANAELGNGTVSTTNEASVSYNFTKPADLELIVTSVASTISANVLFTVGVDTTMPNKTSTSNSLVSLLPPGPSVVPSPDKSCVGPYCEAAYRDANLTQSSNSSTTPPAPSTSSTHSTSKSNSIPPSSSSPTKSSKVSSTKLPTYGHPSSTKDSETSSTKLPTYGHPSSTSSSKASSTKLPTNGHPSSTKSSKTSSTTPPTYGGPSPTADPDENHYGSPQYGPQQHGPPQHGNWGYGDHSNYGSQPENDQGHQGHHGKPAVPCTES